MGNGLRDILKKYCSLRTGVPGDQRHQQMGYICAPFIMIMRGWPIFQLDRLAKASIKTPSNKSSTTIPAAVVNGRFNALYVTNKLTPKIQRSAVKPNTLNIGSGKTFIIPRIIIGR
tara:strand:+ start:161 stop:508 length:348 start_codon:yes stop_codon:yes gene_type:complete